MSAKSKYIRLLLSIDQFFSVLIFNSSEDETISSWVGRNRSGKWQERFINWLFQDDQHCSKSIEWDEV